MNYDMAELGTLIRQAKTVRCGNGDYPVLSMTMHDGLVFQEEKFKKVIASKDRSDYKVVYCNQLVVSFPIDEGVLATQRIADAGIVSPAYGIWDIDQEKILPEFLEYALRCARSINYYKAKLRGSTARRRSLPTPTLLAHTIPLPSKEEQCRILTLIHRVKSIIDLRRQELELLDNLIKARFVEMFGDPQINPFGWAVVNISEVVGGKVSNGFFAKRDDYVDDGNVSILGVANIVNRMYSKVDELPKTDADDKDIEKFEVRYGDILFCRSSLVAEGIGKASIIPENVQEKVLFECHVIRLPLDLNKCVPEFIQTLSTTDFFRNQVIAQSKTATMTTIGQDGILKTDIILPPVDKQREFYDFVKQVHKSKVAVQKALDETQTLFDSLMQKYFG